SSSPSMRLSASRRSSGKSSATRDREAARSAPEALPSDCRRHSISRKSACSTGSADVLGVSPILNIALFLVASLARWLELPFHLKYEIVCQIREGPACSQKLPVLFHIPGSDGSRGPLQGDFCLLQRFAEDPFVAEAGITGNCEWQA